MRIGLVILFALLAIGAGFAAFLVPSAAVIGIWDVLFGACVILFLVMFIRLLGSAAAASVNSQRESASEDKALGRMRPNSR